MTTNRTLAKQAFRCVAIRADDMSEESRTVTLSFSSDEPVEMRDMNGVYREVLEHTPDAVDMARLRAKAPVLFNHNRDALIGVVESAEIRDGKGYATVRFSKSEEGQKRFNEVQDGILSNVSVGYLRNRVVSNGADDRGVETVTVKNWQPMEVSLVTVPADISVGVGRTQDSDGETVPVEQPNPEIKEKQMSEKTSNDTTPKVDVRQVSDSATKQERQRMADIDSVGKVFASKGADVRDLVAQAKSEGWTVDQFRAEAIPQLPNVKPAGKAPELPAKEMKRYSLIRAVECARQGRFDGLEGEVHTELLKSRGDTPVELGIMVPLELFGVRSMTAGTAASGAELVTEQALELIEKLDNKPIVEMAGARRLSGLQGDIVLPKQSGGATAYWVSETESITASDLTTAVTRMTPHRLGVLTKFSSQLRAQSVPSVEAMLRMDMSKRIALALDDAALNGTGTDGEPKGLFSYDTSSSGINTVTYGAAATFAKVNDAVGTILTDNADTGSMGYLITPTAWAKFASKSVDTGSGRFLWNGGLSDGTIGPVRGYVTNQLESNKSVVGVFSELLIGTWQAGNLVVDPYTSKHQSLTELYLEILADIAVRHAESFCISTDSAAQ